MGREPRRPAEPPPEQLIVGQHFGDGRLLPGDHTGVPSVGEVKHNHQCGGEYRYDGRVAPPTVAAPALAFPFAPPAKHALSDSHAFTTVKEIIAAVNNALGVWRVLSACSPAQTASVSRTARWLLATTVHRGSYRNYHYSRRQLREFLPTYGKLTHLEGHQGNLAPQRHPRRVTRRDDGDDRRVRSPPRGATAPPASAASFSTEDRAKLSPGRP
jgi:hypothetical protein